MREHTFNQIIWKIQLRSHKQFLIGDNSLFLDPQSIRSIVLGSGVTGCHNFLALIGHHQIQASIQTFWDGLCPW